MPDDGWQARNNGAGARRWFLVKKEDGRPVDYLLTKSNQLVRFKTYESASKRAAELNGGK